MTDSATFKLAKARWPFAGLAVGDSFFVTGGTLISTLQACENATRLLPGRMFVAYARKPGEDEIHADAGVRVWRTI